MTSNVELPPGGVPPPVALTVSEAEVLVTVPTELEITTSNVSPLSEVEVAGVEYDVDVAPAIFV